MNTTMRHPNRTGAIPHQSTQRGFSLVEIMVALVLGLVIVAAVLGLILAWNLRNRDQIRFRALGQHR